MIDPVYFNEFKRFKDEVFTKEQEMLFDIVCLAVEAQLSFEKNQSILDEKIRTINHNAGLLNNIIDYLGIPESDLYKGFA